jgi:hypothetical protein
MKMAIVGSRSVDDYEWIKSILEFYDGITLIISGGALGVDSLAKKYAVEKNIPLLEIKPEYDKYPQNLKWKAPLDRNTTIVEKCEYVIAFWDGKSKGTLDTVNKAKKFNKPYIVYNINDKGKIVRGKIKSILISRRNGFHGGWMEHFEPIGNNTFVSNGDIVEIEVIK